MLIPNHPNDERLSALASGDADADADAALTEHVSTCIRCTETIAELGALRASLAELPDLRRIGPLRLLPPVDELRPRVDAAGLGTPLLRPVLMAGAALALVGLVGTTSRSSGVARTADSWTSAELSRRSRRQRESRTVSKAGAAPAAKGRTRPRPARPSAGGAAPACSHFARRRATGGRQRQRCGAFSVTAERPIWPMLLFAGVALMIGPRSCAGSSPRAPAELQSAGDSRPRPRRAAAGRSAHRPAPPPIPESRNVDGSGSGRGGRRVRGSGDLPG